MTGSTILCSTPGTEKPKLPSFSGGSGLSLVSKVCGPSVSVIPSELAFGTSASRLLVLGQEGGVASRPGSTTGRGP